MEYLKVNCDKCEYCCISDAANLTEAKNAYCGTKLECSPYSLVQGVIPFLMGIMFIYICIACCIKREQYSADKDDMNFQETLKATRKGTNRRGTGVSFDFTANN